MKLRLLVLAVTAVAMAVAGCTGVSAPGGSPDDVAGTYDQLVDALESEGSAVDTAGTISQPFFEPEGQMIQLVGQEVQVFEFQTEADAETAAGEISPDGGSVGTTMVTWIAPPHFYQAGRLVVLYVGEDQDVLSSLEGVLGPQIAGR